LQSLVEVDSGLKVQLDKKLNDLRRNLLITDAEKIGMTRMKLEGKAYAIPAEFNLKGKNWELKSPDSKMDPSNLGTFLDKLASGHSPLIVSPAPPTGPDSVILSLGDDQNPAKFRFQVYTSPKDKKIYARDLTSNRNEAFELESGLKNSFPFSPDSWKLK
jgi:hypothetical protein